MLVTNGILTHRYVENVHAGMRLGRHLKLDARSLKYRVPAPSVPIKPAEWLPSIPTLDQGNVGSCTGNAGTYSLSSVYKADLSTLAVAGHTLSTTDTAANEQFALEVYHEASQLNGDGSAVYPPDDTGSSGLAVGQALLADKVISKYVWATDAPTFAALLQAGGCLIGMPWYEAFFHPDAHGFIDGDQNWDQSAVAGGHEVYVEALESWDVADLGKSVVRLHNSWSDSWGDHGCGRMTLATYATFKDQVDVKQLLR